MPGPAPAVAAVRVAVRRGLEAHDLTGARVLVGCSGGPDSLALAAAAGFVVPQRGGSVGAVVVDHGLQAQSAAVARQAAQTCLGLGLTPVETVAVRVAVRPGSTGMEDAARVARYAALVEQAVRHGAQTVLLGHTLQDQAEQVLLGLARGSGARSLAGMPAARRHGPVTVLRPLLKLSRDTTAQACAELGLATWADPHNDDGRFTRVRARRLLPRLEADLGPGVVAALARSADLLRADADALDEISDTAYRQLGPTPWTAAQVRGHPRAVRMRLWQRLAVDHEVPPGSLSAAHLASLDALVCDWHGQGPVHLPGGTRGRRRADQVWLERSVTS